MAGGILGPSDYAPWLRTPESWTNTQSSFNLGAQIAQNRVQNALKEKEFQLDAQRSMLQTQEYFSKKEIQNRMMSGTSDLAQTMAGFTDMTDPAIPEKIYSVLAQNPTVEPIAKQFLDLHERAKEFKQKAEQLKAYQSGLLDIKTQEEERKANLALGGGGTEDLQVVKDDTSGAHFYARGGKWYHLPQSLVPADKPIPSATIAQKTTIYRDQIKELESDLSSLTGMTKAKQALPENQAKMKDIESRLSAARARRDALVEPGAAPSAAPGLNTTLKVPAPANPADRQTGKVYVTPKGEFLWNGTGWVTP